MNKKVPTPPRSIVAYVTSYSGTVGIMRVQGVSAGEGMLIYRTPAVSFDLYAHKGQWFLTEEEAQANAKARLIRAAASAEKKLKKLHSRIAEGSPLLNYAPNNA